MRMKEDYQLKPAYNREYVTWVTVGPERTDTTTLPEFLDEVRQYIGHTYTNIVADSGYES